MPECFFFFLFFFFLVLILVLPPSRFRMSLDGAEEAHSPTTYKRVFMAGGLGAHPYRMRTKNSRSNNGDLPPAPLCSIGSTGGSQATRTPGEGLPPPLPPLSTHDKA
jgi:hypothetical protein